MSGIFSVMLLLNLAALTTAKPIMVTFGTNQGPIQPRQPKSTAAQERSYTPQNPAPVFEEREDIPNPNQYHPIVPHQYRSKLYSFKPSPNLILGTPLDIKYSPRLHKYKLAKKDLAKSLKLGVDYTGPHIFETQPYELSSQKEKYQNLEKLERPLETSNNKVKYVPQIGIVYSSGVRYYVPQFVLYNLKKNVNLIDQNSVYDVTDEKY